MVRAGKVRTASRGSRRGAARKASAPPRVSVVLPVYEEAALLGDLVGRIQTTLRRERVSFEIVAVDDGSKDETGRVLRELTASHRRHLVVVRHLVNRGNGAALRSGI